jgi:hypothetical protein
MAGAIDTLAAKIEALEQRLRVLQSDVPKHHVCLDFGDIDQPSIEEQKKEFLTQHNLETEQELREAGGHFVEASLPWLKGMRGVGNMMSVEEYRAAGQHETPSETPYAPAEPCAGADAGSPTRGDE